MNVLFNAIKSLKGHEKGKRAFIVANGPSILKCNLAKCSNDVVIGINAATILQDEAGIEFDYYCVSDQRFLTHPDKKKYALDYVKEKTVCVFRKELKRYFEENKNHYYIKPLGRDGFSFNLGHGFFFGSSTTVMAIQLAAYLGCTEIYLLGVDLKYRKENPRFYQEKTIQIEESSIGIQIHNLIIARKALAEKNIRLFACSENSMARPYLEFLHFDSLF